MIYKKLPNDLKEFIKTFIFDKCEHCKFINYYWDLHLNVTFYEYITIFSDIWDDCYIFKKNFIKFDKICHYCYKNFEETSFYTSNHMLQI